MIDKCTSLKNENNCYKVGYPILFSGFTEIINTKYEKSHRRSLIFNQNQKHKYNHPTPYKKSV